MTSLPTVLLFTGLIFLGIVGIVCVASRRKATVFHFSQMLLGLAWMFLEINFHHVPLNEVASDWSHPSVSQLIDWPVAFWFVILAALYASLNLVWIIRLDPIGGMLDRSGSTKFPTPPSSGNDEFGDT